MQRLLALAAVLAASSLAAERIAAQRTWIVDGRGGPGVDFTDLLTAVPAAAPGDTIRVVGPSATHWACPVIDKGIAIVTDPAASMRIGVLDVANVPAGQSFTSRGFVCFHMSIRDCDGAVFLEELSVTSSALTREMPIEDAALVSLNSGSFRRLRAARSHIVATDVFGMDWCFRHCTTEIAGGFFWGASCPWSAQPTSAVKVRFGTFRATAEAWFTGGGGNYCSRQPGLDAAAGIVELDPSVVLNGHAPPRTPVPAIRGAVVSATRPGSFSVFGIPGEQHVIVAGLPSTTPIPVPGVGDIRVDLATLIPVTVGTIGANGTFDFPVPGGGLRTGTALALQAVRLSPTPHVASIPVFPVVGN